MTAHNVLILSSLVPGLNVHFSAIYQQCSKHWICTKSPNLNIMYSCSLPY